MSTPKAGVPAAPSVVAAPVVLRFGRQDVERLVGPLVRPGAWHLVEERASRFNQLARRFGVRISTRREVWELAVTGRDAAGLSKFQAELQSRPGKIQRALADLLARELGGISAPEPFRRLHDRQQAELAAALDSSLAALRGLGPLMRSHFMPAPFKVEGAAAGPGALETALAILRAREPRSVVVVGSAGAGKTSLLWKAFESLGEEARSGAPVIALSASKLRWKEGGAGLDWSAVLPADQRGMAERFEALFADGKLTLLLDALDEARPLLDWQQPAASAFWTQAARNRCLISCRELYFQKHIQHSPFRRLFGDKLAVVTLLDWTPAHASRLYARLAAAKEGPQALPGVDALGRFSPQFLDGKLKGIRLSAFFAWAFAAFFCRVRKASFPRSEFEMLDYELELICAWERERLMGELPEDMANGLLLRVGWACYRGEDGALGQDAWLRLGKLMEIMRRDFPFHAEKGQRFFDALTRLPIIQFDGAHGSVRMTRMMAEMLAAKHLLSLASREDAEQLSEAFEATLFETASRLLYQGIQLLDGDGRARFFRAASRAFELARGRWRKSPTRGAVTAMQGLLQPVAHLEMPEAAAWLRGLLKRPSELPGPVLVSLGRALSYLGDHQGVEAFLAHLRSSAESRRVNRNFYLYWLKDGVSTSPDGPDYLDKVKAAKWPAAASWLAAKLTARDAAALRRVQLHAFLDLWATLGAPSLPAGELKRVLESLEAEYKAGASQLERELKELRVRCKSGGKK